MNQKRQVSACTHKFAKDMKCTKCGCYHYSNSAIKTNKFASPFHFNLKHYLNSLRKSSTKIVDSRQIEEQTYSLLTSICEKFTFTTQTLALGLYIYQCLHRKNQNQRFWASSALIVAGKAAELDKNVPYLNRYQRYAQKTFSQQEYEKSERTIFEAMNFQIQSSSFIDFLNFYLTCGVLFQEDKINSTLIQFIEDDILSQAKQHLKKGLFTMYSPELLALGIIKQIRLKYNLNGWNSHLQEISGFIEQQIIVRSTSQSPLKEIVLASNQKYKLNELKGINIRKKYENANQDNRPILQKFRTINRSNSKQNSYTCSSKLMIQNRRKPSHSYLLFDGLTNINSQLLNRQR